MSVVFLVALVQTCGGNADSGRLARGTIYASGTLRNAGSEANRGVFACVSYDRRRRVASDSEAVAGSAGRGMLGVGSFRSDDDPPRRFARLNCVPSLGARGGQSPSFRARQLAGLISKS